MILPANSLSVPAAWASSMVSSAARSSMTARLPASMKKSASSVAKAGPTPMMLPNADRSSEADRGGGLHLGAPDGIAAVMAGKELAVGLADATDAEGVDEAGERDRAAGLDRSQEAIDGAPLPAFARQKFVPVGGQTEDVGGSGEPAEGDEFEQRFLAETLDVEGGACGEMTQALEGLGGAETRPPVQRRTTSPGGRTARLPQAGQCVGGVQATGPRGVSGTKPRICGMTSPARCSITVSPARTSLRAISSSLCSVARVTTTPPTFTGWRWATGVNAPVRPTWTSMFSSSVWACSAGNFHAMAQRGVRPTAPRRCWRARSSILKTMPSIS